MVDISKFRASKNVEDRRGEDTTPMTMLSPHSDWPSSFTVEGNNRAVQTTPEKAVAKTNGKNQARMKKR